MLIPAELVHKILMINIAHIGDIVLSTPTTRALKTFLPHADIDMLVSTPQGEAACHNPYVNNVIFYDIDNWQRDRVKLLKLIQSLRNQKYDLALSSRYGSADPMLAWLSGAVYRAGFDMNGSKYLTHSVPSLSPGIKHESESQLEILSTLGVTPAGTHIEFSVSAGEEASLDRKLPYLPRKRLPLVVLCPFSDDSQKNWTHSGYSSVLQTLAEFTDCFLIGTCRQRSALDAINTSAGNVANVLGGSLSLGELGALIKKADLLITVDTGPLHIAQAFQTPVLALMGPTDPRVWGPRKLFDIVLNQPMPCSPCWHKEEAIRSSCRDNECMRRIQPADVIQSAAGILANSVKKNR